MRTLIAALCLLAFLLPALAADPQLQPAIAPASGPLVRVKDIAEVLEARENQLIGYGLVVGLSGTGDGGRGTAYTASSLRAALEQLGVPSEPGAVEPVNVASVIVTATLPHSARPGARLDATVSAVGDAASLRGGVLLMTPLLGADGHTYAVAQGSLLVGGFRAAGAAEAVQGGVPTVAQLRGSVLVERPSPAGLGASLTLSLRYPDFGTAVRLVDAVNTRSAALFGAAVAREVDAGTVALSVPSGLSAARFLAVVENVTLRTDGPARVVVDERTGTVVVGADVRVSRVAVSHGQLTIRVTEEPRIVQPLPFSDGVTAVEPLTEIAVAQAGDKLAIVEGPSLRDLVAGLNALGVGPDGVIAILSNLHAAGALQAELVVQ